MKTYYSNLTLLFAILVSTCVFSQTDLYLANDSAHYRFTYQYLCGPASTTFCYTTENIIFKPLASSSDTVMVFHQDNNFTIALLTVLGKAVMVKPFGSPNSSGCPHFTIDDWDTLYSYDMQIGDSSYLYYGEMGVLDQIDTLIIDGEQRLKYTFSNINDVWIQGHGSTIHPLNPILDYFECHYSTQCASLYFDGQSSVDSMFYNGKCSGVGLPEHSDEAISIYPNPVKLSEGGMLNVPVKNQIQFSVFDLKGKECVNGQIKNGQIDLNSLIPGVYLLKIYENKQLNSSRIVVSP
jgi:hypothetical protein